MSKLRQFIELENIELVTCEDKFSYRDDKPWWNRWAQKCALWLLRRLKAYAQENCVHRVHTLPDGPLLNQIPEVLERIDPRRVDDQMVVIGAKTYAEAVRSESEAPRCSFGVVDELMYNRSVFGVPVLVVPHVEGWAVVPREPEVRVH